MSRSQAGIRRDAATASQFTQIANALFRDPRVSLRAKGIFGYVSTHRSGWQLTIDDLVRVGPDGRDAVRTGLWELEAHGYLIRERLRRPDGTLAKIVYCITDRPATVDLALIEAGLGSMVFDTEAGGGVGSGVRRGVMAADQFTQIANALFRDARLSFKAKGLYGLLSTHRDGWRMTVAGLARRSREGEAAVKSGLKELEQHGFLARERERGPGGTLGPVTYRITELPALQHPRSRPESGFPPVGEPTLAERPTKNTNRKNTTQQNTSPLRPCERGDAAHTSSGTPAPDATPPAPPADELHPGIQLLLEIAASHPELLLTGKALTDQGRILTVMMDAGWSREQLQPVITSRPLPQPVRTSVGAIIAARLRAAQAYPPPATMTPHRHDDVLDAETPWEPPAARTSTASVARSVTEALTYRALVECTGCGRPGTAPGEDLCPTCLDWPLCHTCPGPTPRRAHPDGDGRCRTCTSALARVHEDTTP
ncbi:helix-turn-helix domain-containing protein [Streptomyces sp. NPDC021056]|uniref:helix-turn-helix domain-containing protein n=1 Tax=Streptomyces sp. NPDC021056 TaxID=3155012 RepID=UPI0033C881BD